MGFLEQLEEEARQQREQEERLALEREEREVFFREIADPTFRELFEYLKRLTGHLNYLGNRAEVRYSAPGYGKLIGHMNDDLRVRFSSDECTRTIDIAGTVEFPRQRSLDVAGEPDVLRMQNFARELGLHTNESTRRDQRGSIVAGTFRLSGRINLRVLVTTSVDVPEFQMQFTNVSDFGRMVKVVPPEQMDGSLMDKLGRFVARVDDDFLREDLADEIREELALRLKRERHAMIQDMGRSDRERERAAQEEATRTETARRLSGRFQFRLEEARRKLAGDD